MVTAAALTDKTGYAYGPYGETVASGTEIAQPFQYTGREWDGETGLYYYRARYYAPEMGRFISEDPIGFAGGINFYAYVGNDPVNFVDPLGLFEVTMRCKSQGLAGQSASLWSP
jgi:RHS repeat-associated protein